MRGGEAGDLVSQSVVITADLEFCPACEPKQVPLVRTGTNDRICNTCGFSCTLVTPKDEADLEADMLVRSRKWNEEHGHARLIGKFQTRW